RRGRAGALARRAAAQALGAAGRRRDAAFVRVRGERGVAPARRRAAGRLGGAGAHALPRGLLRDRRRVPPARGAGCDRAAAGRVRAGEGRVRAPVRAEQPARLGRDPGARNPTLDRGDLHPRVIELGADPHAILGAHEANGGVVVRAYRPEAQAVRVQPAGIPAELWEAMLPKARLPLAYELEVEYPNGVTFTMRDPYAFLPTLGELDLHLAMEGRHE